MNSPELNVPWRGPWSLPEGLAVAQSVPRETGVYMWTWKNYPERPVNYVGYASNIWERQYQHVIYLLGGGYPIETHPGDARWTPDRPRSGTAEDDYGASVARMRWILSDPQGAIAEARDFLDRISLFAATMPADAARTVEWTLQTHLGLDRRGSKRMAPIGMLRNGKPTEWKGPDFGVFGRSLEVSPDGAVHPV